MCLFFCSTSYCAASESVCPSRMFCLSRCVCWAALWQPLMYLDFYSAAVCTVPGGVRPAAACAWPGRICSTAACAVPEDGLQPAACGAPGLSVYNSQCCTETCLSTRAFVCTWGVCQLYTVEPVLHLFVSVYKSLVLHLEVSVFNSLCCICAFLSTRALFCTCASLQSTRVLCCTWTCLPTRVQCMLYL